VREGICRAARSRYSALVSYCCRARVGASSPAGQKRVSMDCSMDQVGFDVSSIAQRSGRPICLVVGASSDR